MTSRVSSGSDRIDLVVGGGLPAHGINMVVGRPGSGKTILAQQYAFHNASPEHPAVYLSTVSEPLEKILRYGDSLTFFNRAAVGSSVIYDELGRCVNEGGLDGVLGRVTSLLQKRRPGVMVIDSFKALRPYAGSEGDFRRFLHEMAGRLSALPVTSLWVGEYEGTEALNAPEFAVADAIVLLSSHRAAEREVRFLQVLKLRGSGFLSGRHAYRLSASGLELFPRLADPIDSTIYGSSPARISSGVLPLDVMLSDGYIEGASTLIAGPSGSGKTLLCLHFLMTGARIGEPGLIATMQENPIQLERTLNGYGWTLEEAGIELMYRTPVDLYLDEWVYDLLAAIERTGTKRVMIDSLGDLQAIAGDEVRFREYMYSLLQRCARQGVSVMMTQEMPELFGATRLSEYGISHLSDNVVLLQFRLGESKVKRAITVIKTRSSGHDSTVREFDITSDGFVLADSQ